MIYSTARENSHLWNLEILSNDHVETAEISPKNNSYGVSEAIKTTQIEDTTSLEQSTNNSVSDHIISQMISTIGPLISWKDFKKSQWAKVTSLKTKLNGEATTCLKDCLDYNESMPNLDGSLDQNSEPEVRNQEFKDQISSFLTPEQIHDTFSIFTQKKLEVFFSLSSTKFLFKYYSENLNRLHSHKVMKSQPSKYLYVKVKLLEMCSSE